MFAKVLPLNKMLHAGQFVGCEYSIVGCPFDMVYGKKLHPLNQ